MKKFTLILATVALLAAGCTKTEVVGPQNRKGINFAAYTAKTTKAVQKDVTTENLDNFKVTAFGNGALYFDNVTFKKSTESIESTESTESTEITVWKSDTKYFWPAFPLTFYAYNTPYGYGTGVQPTGFVIEMGEDTTLTVIPATKLANQEDLVAAYAKSKKESDATSTGKSLSLTFNHYLTQVIVKAKNSSSAYKVVVDGVKIANMAGQGTYTFSTNKMAAPAGIMNNTNSIDYTATFAPKTLTSGAQEVMTDAGKGRWYLIPQSVRAWKQGKDVDDPDLKNNNTVNGTANGTYLALKVLISTKAGAQIYPKTGSETAWMAVPVPAAQEFAQGKRYTIILDFFGNNGAGYVDPEVPGELDGDNQTDDSGKPIVGSEIKFNAEVVNWQDVEITISL